jgi:predicted membrane chloride channel (bestrophin family)
MIQYHRYAFGLNLLLRVHGSAVYRAMIPGSISVLFLIWIRYMWGQDGQNADGTSAAREIEHPYAVGVLVASITFLLVFRTQQAYARYWEACTAVHHMMSKWMDATIHTANFHMQCAHYDHIKPPSYFDYHHLNKEFLTRDREDVGDGTGSDGESEAESVRIGNRAVNKSIQKVTKSSHGPTSHRASSKINLTAESVSRLNSSSSHGTLEQQGPGSLMGKPRMDGNWGELFDDGKATFWNPKAPNEQHKKGFASFQGGRTPPLFLQELAHLSSLMTGVALSTLRNDIEGAESPLDIYEPGSPWPEVDPDKEKNLELFYGSARQSLQKVVSFFGFGATPNQRTRYNAARPLPIVGGVSEGEIQFLQMARGPYAKTQLAFGWLSEFIIREHLAGSTGNVGPPIISRIIQFLGDGMIYYNHARKIMFIPFPFPHAQLSVVYVLVVIPAVALLMDQYADELWLGSLLTFFTVTALAGIHEVARELENPFRNIPNELPLVTLQAQYNEALITMYAGFHPDSYWKKEAKQYAKKPESIIEDDDEDEGSVASKTAGTEPGAASQQHNGSKNISVTEEVQRLIAKIEQQGIELERLRNMVVNSNMEEKKSDSGTIRMDPAITVVDDRKNR